MKLKTGISLICVLLFLFVILASQPVNEKNCLSIKGIVSEVYEGREGGDFDVVFRLKGEKQIFYVNRGLENGLSLKKLQAELTNKEILIKYPNYWTFLDIAYPMRHISKLELEGKTLYTEL